MEIRNTMFEMVYWPRFWSSFNNVLIIIINYMVYVGICLKCFVLTIRKWLHPLLNRSLQKRYITSLDLHIGRYRVLFAVRAVRLCWRGRHRLLVVMLYVRAVIGQQRRRSASGRRRDRFSFFNQFDYLVSFFRQVAIWSEGIVPSVRTETQTEYRSIT